MTTHNYKTIIKVKEVNCYGKYNSYFGFDVAGYYSLVDKEHVKIFDTEEVARQAWESYKDEIIRREDKKGATIKKVKLITTEQTINETVIWREENG